MDGKLGNKKSDNKSILEKMGLKQSLNVTNGKYTKLNFLFKNITMLIKQLHEGEIQPLGQLGEFVHSHPNFSSKFYPNTAELYSHIC